MSDLCLDLFCNDEVVTLSFSVFLRPDYVLAAVYADGGICLDILQNQWSPIYDVSAILTSIQVQLLASISPR